MSHTPHLQFTSVRTRLLVQRALIGLKHTAEDAAGESIELPWVDLTPEDAATLVNDLQQALDELGPATSPDDK